MKVKVGRVGGEVLEKTINEIGYENILQIIPDHEYETTLYVLIYEEKAIEEEDRVYKIAEKLLSQMIDNLEK